jgi:hypothetical protein
VDLRPWSAPGFRAVLHGEQAAQALRPDDRPGELYDFRLPMPLLVGQIVGFTAVAVPYVVLLTLFGLPFNHTLLWLYVLLPGLLAWLATRPVLESRRLPELLISQVRYLGEPSRLVPDGPARRKGPGHDVRPGTWSERPAAP